MADRLLGGHKELSISLSVLESNTLGAYGWPDGHLYVTRSLIDTVDNDELAAAVSHELGHLMVDGHVRSLVSLSGSAQNADTETRADAAGVALLEARGFDPGAMARMLSRLRTANELKLLIQRKLVDRIEILTTRSFPAPATEQ